MVRAATLEVQIGAEISDFNSRMSEVERKISRIGQKLQAVGKKMSLAITIPLIAIGTASIKTAMDAIESENLFAESMKGMAGAARKWSEKLRDQLGLNSFETRKTAGTFNVMMKSMGLSEQAAYGMAKGLTKLGYDMASFYNLKSDEAFLKLQSAISGEVEPLKRLGIIVNETTIKTWALNSGLIKQGETMTEAQKVTARYNVIMEQTVDAQGDLERTLDSPTNKIRILQSRIKELAIEMGMKLLPVFERILAHVEKGIKWFSGLSDSTKELIIKFAGLAAIAGPLLIISGKLLTILPALKVAFITLTGPIGLATVAIVAIAISVKTLADNLNKAKKSMSDFADEAAVFANAAENFKKLWITVRKQGGETLEQFNELMKRFGGNWEMIMGTIVKDPKFATLKALLMDIASGVKTVELGGKDLSITLPASFLKVKEAVVKSKEKFDLWATTVGKIFHETSVRAAEMRGAIETKLIMPPIAIDMPKASFDDLEEFQKEWLIRFYERLEEMRNKFVNTFCRIADAVGNFFSQIGALADVNYQNQINKIDSEYARRKEGIENSTMDEEEKAKALEKIDKQYEAKKKAIQKKAFENQKRIQKVAAVINIAEAITEALPNLFLVALTAAAGAIQLAAISAQTFPGLQEGGWIPSPMPVMAGHGPKGEIIAQPSTLARIISQEMPRQARALGSSDPFFQQAQELKIRISFDDFHGIKFRDQVVRIVVDEARKRAYTLPHGVIA